MWPKKKKQQKLLQPAIMVRFDIVCIRAAFGWPLKNQLHEDIFPILILCVITEFLPLLVIKHPAVIKNLLSTAPPSVRLWYIYFTKLTNNTDNNWRPSLIFGTVSFHHNFKIIMVLVNSIERVPLVVEENQAIRLRKQTKNLHHQPKIQLQFACTAYNSLMCLHVFKLI